MAVSGTTATDPLASIRQIDNPSQSKAESASKKLGDDFETFLKLLTTQLQTQDPTDPLDTNEFTQQLVMFSSVEQAVATNDNLEKLIGMSKDSQLNSAVSYIGKAVEAKGDQGVLENGVGEFTYNLPVKAETVDVSIFSASGGLVFSGVGSTKAGRNVVLWDGTNSITGNPVSDGLYKFKVDAKDADGNKIEGTTFTSGRVTAVDFNGDEETTISIGTIKVKLSDVLSVREAPVAAAPNQNNQQSQNNT